MMKLSIISDNFTVNYHLVPVDMFLTPSEEELPPPLLPLLDSTASSISISITSIEGDS
ncbi:MAG: hypothetical protein SNG38_09400 [Rikenellaceae bacterium]